MNAIDLALATLFSSIVGSLHCVGMCSPFAILAMGSTPSSLGKSQRAARLTSYHLGRLLTYLLMGLAIALLSDSFRRVTGNGSARHWVGWGVGALMIGIGATRLFAATWHQNTSIQHSVWVERWTRSVINLRKRVSGGPAWLTSFVWGFSSTFLPCGWLYLFVLAAAAAPAISTALAMMIAFWIGTLPLLTLSAWSWSSISPRWQVLAQPFAAICIIAFGTYTLVHRSEVDLTPVASAASGRSSLETIRDAINADLPCCIGRPFPPAMNPNEIEFEGGSYAKNP
jgi:sulfite exporter TauE/SafE